jgi:hypothetical protein
MLFDIDFVQREVTSRLSNDELATIEFGDDLEMVSSTRRVDHRCSGKGTPVFFEAMLDRGGVLRVPRNKYEELRWAREVKK